MDIGKTTPCVSCGTFDYDRAIIPNTEVRVCIKCISEFLIESDEMSKKLKVYVAKRKIMKGK